MTREVGTRTQVIFARMLKNDGDTIRKLRDEGALFVVSDSGGKDSQAMRVLIEWLVPASQILYLHADLGRIEWDGIKAQIARETGEAITFATPQGRGKSVWSNEAGENLADPTRFIVCKNENATFLGTWRRKKMAPSPKYRQCTSDLKRGPLERTIRHYLAANPQYNNLVVDCCGIRAEESPKRKKGIAKKGTLAFDKGNSKAGRRWYKWTPVADMTIDEVFEVITEAGLSPHEAYGFDAEAFKNRTPTAYGNSRPAYITRMTRLSCRFCIMSSKDDLRMAASMSPALYAEYVAMEKETGHTFMMPEKGEAKGLEAFTGMTVDAAYAASGTPQRSAAATRSLPMAA